MQKYINVYIQYINTVMKQCVDNYVTPLTHIINLSIAQGYFPDEWKLAKVIPISKDGDPQDIQNLCTSIFI